jgi:hypothetical protein
LKTFLTQFGSALPLTPDPPVKLHDDKKSGMTIETQFKDHFCQKRNVLSPTPHVPTPRTRRAHHAPPLFLGMGLSGVLSALHALWLNWGYPACYLALGLA